MGETPMPPVCESSVQNLSARAAMRGRTGFLFYAEQIAALEFLPLAVRSRETEDVLRL
jgi:hypothetical protein